jgi:thioredoxin 1
MAVGAALCCVSPASLRAGETPAAGTNAAAAAAELPRLVDLGAGKCIPCKMMAPILEDLKKEYKGRMQVEVFDISKEPEAAKAYAVRVIPTQIFFDSAGKELFRHEGFIAKQDILKQWKDLGIVFPESKSAKPEGGAKEPKK